MTVPCPHGGCSGHMDVAPGGEVERMLLCGTCGEYYYKVGAVICIRCCTPVDCDQADQMLGAPDGQRLKPEMVDHLRKMRERWGLPPLEEDEDT